MSRGKSSKTIERLNAAIEILEEIQPATVRAICYRLFVLGLIPDMSKSSTNSISRILTQGREDGDIVWSYIVDETREAETSGIRLQPGRPEPARPLVATPNPADPPFPRGIPRCS